MSLTDAELERYSRSICLSELGAEGQERLKNAAVLVIGAGGVGCPCISYLAASGIGRIGIADGDTVSLSNLQRQVLYTTADLGKNKAELAARAVSRLNPQVAVETLSHDLTPAELREIAPRYDLVAEAADGLAQKVALGSACLAAQRPVCHLAVGGFYIQLLTCLPNRADSFARLFGGHGDAEAGGAFGPVCGIAGSLLALEAVKYILRKGRLYTDSALVIDALTGGFDEVKAP